MTSQPCFWPGGPKQPLPGSSGPGQMSHKYLSPGGATHMLTIHLCVAPLGLDRFSPDNLRCLTAPARVVTALRACSTDSRPSFYRVTLGTWVLGSLGPVTVSRRYRWRTRYRCVPVSCHNRSNGVARERRPSARRTAANCVRRRSRRRSTPCPANSRHKLPGPGAPGAAARKSDGTATPSYGLPDS